MERSNIDDGIISKLILEDAHLSWWLKDVKRNLITIPDSPKERLGIESNEISFTEFIHMVREDYRDRIKERITVSSNDTKFDYKLPLITLEGEIWIHLKAIKYIVINGNTVMLGRTQVINNPEKHSPKQAIVLRTNNLLSQLHNVSQILFSFLQTDKPDEVINNILKDILKQFKAGRTYIFEYNFEESTQTNTYEVVDETVTPEIEMLTNLPFEDFLWWTEQITQKKRSIILSTLDDLPPEAASERNLLEIQDVNSLFVAPLMSKNGAWGYAGVDIVDGFHTWTQEDKDWLLAMFNIISICIQLQRSEKEAKLGKAYLENLYKNMPLGYFRINLLFNEENEVCDYIISDANPAMEHLSKEKFSNYIGKKASEMPEQYIDRNMKDLAQVSQGGEYLETDYYISNSEKHVRLVMYSIQKDEVICLLSDITESYKNKQKLIKEKEKAEVNDRLKSAFLANMSHEIRTPLNAIIGFSDLLSETDDPEDRRTYAKVINKNNDLLLQLISDILDISKIEAGTLDIVYSHVDVNQMCKEVIHFYNLKTQNSLVNVSFEEYLPSCIIHSDKNRLTQILNNFINNALKFTSEGSISVGYRLENENTVKFYVRDTGCGISEENQKNIFDRFVKLNGFVPGTGLGLSICRSLIEQMGGSIGVESVINEGSCFWFTHPYQEDFQPVISEPICKKGSIRSENKENRKPLILIAEDTESNYMLLSYILKNKYELVRALNGQEAVELFKEHQPDLLLTDIKMPVMGGFEAVRQIRSINSNMPIVAVTAYAFESDKQQALDAGCDAYLSKPIKASKLLQLMHKLLNESPG